MNLEQICKAVVDGEQLEVKKYQLWEKVDGATAIQTFLHSPASVRIKPKFQSIDMQAMRLNGVDCEFSNSVKFDTLPIVGELYSHSEDPVETHPYYVHHMANNSGHPIPPPKNFKYCRPRLNHWFITHTSRARETLPDGLFVECKLKTQSGLLPVITGKDDWPEGIYAINIRGLAEGYYWPWE